MFQSSIASILSGLNTKSAKKSEFSNYSWRKWTKSGSIFAITTGAFFALKATGSFSLISSWLKNTKMDFDEQETKLAVRKEIEGIETYSEYQRTGLSLTDFESSKALRTNDFLQLTDFEESPLTAVKDSHEHITFMPQRTKRNSMEIPGKIGPEFQVNTYTINEQDYSSIAKLSDGKFVVTWESYEQDGDSDGIYGQMFNADGSKYLSEFQVNTYTPSYQEDPSIAGLSDGKFVVTWHSGQDGDSGGVYGQMYNADGNKYSSEFQVNTYTTNGQWGPSIAGLSDGKFVVTWYSWNQDGSDRGIYGQMFNADGTKYNSEFRVNTYTTNAQCYSSIAGLSDGKFVVTWMSLGQDGDDWGIYGQMYNADGNKYSSEFQVNTYTINDQGSPSVVGLSDGKFVVTWRSNGQDGDDYGIYGQMFYADGSKYSSEFRVNTYTTDYQAGPSVAGLSDGKFVVTWTSYGQDGGYLHDIYGQMYNADGTGYSSEFQVNTYTASGQEYPSVAGLSDGKFVVTWTSYGQDGSSDGIYGQTFGQSVRSSTSTAGTSLTSTTGTSTSTAGTNPIGIIIGAVVGGISVVLCIAAGSGVGYLLYRRNKKDSVELDTVKSTEDSSLQIISENEDKETASGITKEQDHDDAVELLETTPEQEQEQEKAKISSTSTILDQLSVEEPPVVEPTLQPSAAELQPTSSLEKPTSQTKGKSHKALIDDEGQIKVTVTLIPYSKLTFGKCLGEGSFGTVYQGTWQYDEVAIKQLRMTNMSVETLDEFKSEASIMANLRHPRIIGFYGISVDTPGRYSIVMDYMAGGSLYNLLHNQQPLIWESRYRIALDITGGLAHLHSKDILHRDLKSLNVLLDSHLRARLTDFGLSRIKTETANTTTAASQSVGTLPWMAPELFERRAKYTRSADMYSYGMVLWELASRKVPFSDVPNKDVLIRWLEKGEQEDIPEDCPSGFAKLIKWCWNKVPTRRPTIDQAASVLNEPEPTEQSPAPNYLDNLESQDLENYQDNLDSEVLSFQK